MRRWYAGAATSHVALVARPSGSPPARWCAPLGCSSHGRRPRLYSRSDVWITDQVDLPTGLIAAQQRGDLVVFVGAGASIDAPSSLPSFAGLTERIAVGAGVEAPTGPVPLDQFLGDLDGSIDVHQRVHDIISNAASQPNALHRALVRLPKGNPDVRIVTTNYDLHLSESRAELGDTLTEFDGPALPLGNDFSGIVYLHGSVRQPPRFLVVTDRDFGHAYLTEAWAARFLHAMFDGTSCCSSDTATTTWS